MVLPLSLSFTLSKCQAHMKFCEMNRKKKICIVCIFHNACIHIFLCFVSIDLMTQVLTRHGIKI